MKILLSGYYGFGNVGDEAVLKAIVEGLRSHDITVISGSPELTKEFYKVDSVYFFDWKNILKAMVKTDVFISGGGTLFQNATSSRSFLYYMGLVLLAKLLRKKVVVFAQGFGPLNKICCRTCARLVLNRVNLITLRDKDSLEAVKQLGIRKPPVHLTADPSALLEVPTPEQGKKLLSLEGIKKGERPLLGISLRSFKQWNQAKLIGVISRTIDWLAEEHNYYPVFILFQCPQDMHETSQVISFMKADSSVIFRVCKPEEMLALISQFDLFIGMRLHSLIFAAMTGVPMLGLSYDPKVEAFMRSIEQPCLELSQDLNLETLKGKLEKILREKKTIKDKLGVKKKELSNKASENFDLLFKRSKIQDQNPKL